MDSQAQLKRDQAQEPIKIHHPEEEEHREKGPAKVLKKVKEKAKKIKKALTKHGHSHDQDRGGQHIPDDHDLDQEDDEDDDEVDQQFHGGAPRKAHIPTKEDDLIPPGTRAFPVVPKPSDPTRGGSYASHSHEAPSRPVRALGAATLTPQNTPVSLHSATEDVTRTFLPGEGKSQDQRRVNMERPRGLEEDPAGFGTHGGMSNYQSKVTDPTGKGTGEIGGAATSVTALGRKKETDEEDEHHLGVGRDLPVRSSGSNQKTEEMHQPDQSSYTDKIAAATSVVTEKAVAAKNAVASKLGYTGETEETPSSGGGYGSMVAEKLTPVYEKVKETGANAMTKLPSPLAGGTETHQGEDKGVSAKEYLSEKLSPGEEDKALSEVVTEKLHLGGEGENTTEKKGIVTQSEEVEKRLGKFTDQRSEEERKHGEAVVGEVDGGIAEKLRDAVTSWISGTTEEVVQKSTESSSQTLGNTVGKMAGQEGGGEGGNMPVQKRFRE